MRRWCQRVAEGAQPATIDVHHHMLPPRLANALAEHGVHTMGGEPLPVWQPQASLDIMDRNNIARAVLSAPIPLHFLEPGPAATMASEINRFAEECARRWPDRFTYFASLPLPDIDAAVAEAISALDGHGAAGVAMLSNHAGLYQGDPRVANMLLNHVDRRFHDIRFVFTHSATCIPSVLHKLLDRKPIVEAYTAYTRDHGGPPPVQDLLTRLRAAEDEARQRIRWFYFDTALSTAAPVLDALTAIVPTTHILLGTDFPFGQEIGLRYTLDGIHTYPHFTDSDRSQVLATNARALLGKPPSCVC